MTTRNRDIRSVVDGRAVTMLYQPIVDLETGAVVAYEALARGPAGSELESPAALFPAAARAGLGPDLDLLCRSSAVETASASADRDDFVLFVNGEPAYLPHGGELARSADRRADRGRVILELAERSVFARPADLLAAVAQARSQGWGIAVDDVGKTTDSLSLLPLVDPDVVKLDLSIIQDRPGRTAGLTLNGVLHHVEESGCLVLAEGIETEAHLARARALGATLGQGWYFGYPAPLPVTGERVHGRWPGEPWTSGRSSQSLVPDRAAPFDLVADNPRLRRATKEVLYALSLDIESQAAAQPDGAVVFGCFQREEHLTPATCERWRRLAEHGSLVAVLGHQVEPDPVPGVRGVPFDLDDPIIDEWTVVALSSHFAGALIARDLGDRGPDALRRFDYLITYDRSLVVAASRILLGRVLPTA